MSTPRMTTFESLPLSKPILNALKQCEYHHPTPIQEEAIPLVKAGKDVIAKAPTGTGKTAAFVLPALENVLKAKTRIKPHVLILTPTRELATQITDVIYKFGKALKELRVNATSILGGMPYREQLRKLSRPNDMIIATPGRLIDYMKRGNLDFSQIEMLVLDEADRMLDMGFIDDVKYIVEATPKTRQTLLFTATLDDKLAKLASSILKSPQHIEVTHQKENLDNIAQRIYVADDTAHKIKLLEHLLATENVYKAIIFAGMKRNAEALAKQLRLAGYAASALHGDMRQHKRNSTIARFKQGKIQLLIATDVAARGIDVRDISHVFIYDLSRFAEDHIHRIGRTGRAGKKGVAISLVLPAEAIHLQKIERLTKQSLPRRIISGLEPKRSLEVKRKLSRSSKSSRSFGKASGNFQHPSRHYGAKTRRGDSERGSAMTYTGRDFYASSAPAHSAAYSHKKKPKFGVHSQQSVSRTRVSDRQPQARDGEEAGNYRAKKRTPAKHFSRSDFGHSNHTKASRPSFTDKKGFEKKKRRASHPFVSDKK